MCMSADAKFVRTTVSLREDHYQRLKRGDTGISEALNAILEQAFHRDHSLFGTLDLGPVDPDEVRDHQDRV